MSEKAKRKPKRLVFTIEYEIDVESAFESAGLAEAVARLREDGAATVVDVRVEP